MSWICLCMVALDAICLSFLSPSEAPQMFEWPLLDTPLSSLLVHLFLLRLNSQVSSPHDCEVGNLRKPLQVF